MSSRVRTGTTSGRWRRRCESWTRRPARGSCGVSRVGPRLCDRRGRTRQIRRHGGPRPPGGTQGQTWFLVFLSPRKPRTRSEPELPLATSGRGASGSGGRRRGGRPPMRWTRTRHFEAGDRPDQAVDAPLRFPQSHGMSPGPHRWHWFSLRFLADCRFGFASPLKAGCRIRRGGTWRRRAEPVRQENHDDRQQRRPRQGDPDRLRVEPSTLEGDVFRVEIESGHESQYLRTVRARRGRSAQGGGSAPPWASSCA